MEGAALLGGDLLDVAGGAEVCGGLDYEGAVGVVQECDFCVAAANREAKAGYWDQKGLDGTEDFAGGGFEIMTQHQVEWKRRGSEEGGELFDVFQGKREGGGGHGARDPGALDEAEDEIAENEITAGDGVEHVPFLGGEIGEDHVGVFRADQFFDGAGVGAFQVSQLFEDDSPGGDRKPAGADFRFGIFQGGEGSAEGIWHEVGAVSKGRIEKRGREHAHAGGSF